MNYPWECQRCGEPIGYLGRLFQWLRMSPHDCGKYLADVQYDRRIAEIMDEDAPLRKRRPF